MGIAVFAGNVLLLAEEPASDSPAPLSMKEMLPELHLLEPFWRSDVVHRESVLFLKEQGAEQATGTLLFTPRQILAVHRADGTKHFEEGVDFILSEDRTRLVRLEDSGIPFLNADDLMMPRGARPLWTGGEQPAVPCALAHKLGDPDTHLLFDNGHWYHDQQIEVTYLRDPESWPGTVPEFAADQLPETIQKLKSGKPLKIGVSGDSITYGLNSSGLANVPPYMPMYATLVGAQLEAHYGSAVNVNNRAISAWNVRNGIADLENLLAEPLDLIIIAYGMNDVSYRDPVAFQSGVREIITKTREVYPKCEFLLVSPMVGNGQWVHTPTEMFPKYRDALAAISNDEPGTALADITSIWDGMLKKKRDSDLTGNGVNHPSDFGHRVYAAAILSLLIEPQKP